MSPDLARRNALLAMLAAGSLGTAGCSRAVKAPEFSYTLLDGTPSSSRTMAGQVLLVNFWATSCAPCLQEMPALVDTYRKFHARGFQTLAVAASYDPPALVSRFAEHHALPFGVVIDNTGAIARAFADVPVTPTTFLIDRRGLIVLRHEGTADFPALHARIDKLLSQA